MTPSHYERIGGREKVRALTQKFYQIMDELPEAYDIRTLHPENLKNSEEKLFKFLSGWMGGPQLFIEQYGHPMLRQRHLPFPIGGTERDQWLMCMEQALQDVVEDATLRAELNSSFAKVADHMRNRAEH
ncbi:MAG: group II truncated hemoglobin [Nitrosomonadales bacterium]